MAWRSPNDPVGLSFGDQLMLEEVLQLLASDDSAAAEGSPPATDAEQNTSPSMDAGAPGSEYEQKLAPGQQTEGDAEEYKPAAKPGRSLPSITEELLRTPRPHGGPLGAPDSPLWVPSLMDSNPSGVDVPLTPSTASSAVLEPARAAISALPDDELKPDLLLPAQEISTANVLPTGQTVHATNDVEFDELRRKLQMQTASRRYRKRKKEKARQEKARIQELQAELARLRELEADHLQYQQQPLAVVENELEARKNEVEELTEQVVAAAKEESEWMHTISNLRK